MTDKRDSADGGGLPLVRLSLAIPFLEELGRRGVGAQDAVTSVALSLEAIHTPETFVPAPVMYALLEALAQAAKDPFLAVSVGEALVLPDWPPFTDATDGASSLGDFCNRFVIATASHATSVRWEIHTDGSHATFKSRRTFQPTLNPSQADAFYAGLFVNIFRQVSGIQWQSRQVSVTVCDLSALPRNYADLNLREGDRSGPSIRFPATWLVQPIQIIPTKPSTQSDLPAPPRALVMSVRESLQPYLHLQELSSARAASICGYSERVLRRKLQVAGTSLSREIAALREEKACLMLRNTDDTIARVAEAVGFSSPSVFARWFRKRTGTTPKAYRTDPISR